MEKADVVEARSAAYRLLAGLLHRGLTEESRRAAKEIPDLRDTLPRQFNADEAAADHQELFGFNVLPYASVYLEPEGQLGGEVSRMVGARYSRTEYEPVAAALGADHVSSELGYLSWLCDIEATLRRSGDDAQVDRIVQEARVFLDEHLLWWLPGLSYAVGRDADPFFARVCEVALDLALDQRRKIDERPVAPGVLGPFEDEILEKASTGVIDIAHFLTTTAKSGLVLTRAEITRIGREEGLPRGFGDRSMMLANLLRAAATYDQLGNVLGKMSNMVTEWVKYYRELEDTTGHLLPAVRTAWETRLHATAHLLDRIDSAVLTAD